MGTGNEGGMMETRTFNITTEQQRAVFAAFVTRQAVPFAAEIGPEKRSLPQNARYWKLVGMAAEHIGCSSADLHEDLLAEHYGSTNVTLPSGAIRRVPIKRSHDRNKVEFKKLMDWAEIYLGENLGIWLDGSE